MSRQIEQLWSTLFKAGVVNEQEPEKGGLESPWYVKALLAFSGWLAAMLLLGFLAIGFEYIFRNNYVALILGTIMIGAAFAMLRTDKNEFVEHLALATSLAGQALVVYAIIDMTAANEAIAWLLVALLQLFLLIIMPNFVHRVCSSFVAAFAFSMALAEIDRANISNAFILFIATFFWLNEFYYPQHIKKIRAIAYGLTLALITLKGTTLFGYKMLGGQFYKNQSELWTQAWVGELLIGFVSIYVVWSLLQRYDKAITERLSIAALLGTILICAVSIKVQGITIGMVILLLGFSGTNRVLITLGILSLIFYISYYYYLLDTTLINKSLNLFIVGITLLGIRWFIKRIIPLDTFRPDKEVPGV